MDELFTKSNKIEIRMPGEGIVPQSDKKDKAYLKR